MGECCEVREIPREQRRVLYLVLWINVAMFLVESVPASWRTPRRSWPIRRHARRCDRLRIQPLRHQSGPSAGAAAMLKGIIMAAFGVGVLAQVVMKIAQGLRRPPKSWATVGVLALAANLLCLLLLCVPGRRHQHAPRRGSARETTIGTWGACRGGRGWAHRLGVAGHRHRVARGRRLRPLGGSGHPRGVAVTWRSAHSISRHPSGRCSPEHECFTEHELTR